MASGVRFIRKNGHVIPIRASSGASTDSKKRYPAVKRAGLGAAVVGATVNAALASHFKLNKFAVAGLAGLGAYAWGTSVTTKKAKGESNKHAADRIAHWMNSRKYR